MLILKMLFRINRCSQVAIVAGCVASKHTDFHKLGPNPTWLKSFSVDSIKLIMTWKYFNFSNFTWSTCWHALRISNLNLRVLASFVRWVLPGFFNLTFLSEIWKLLTELKQKITQFSTPTRVQHFLIKHTLRVALKLISLRIALCLLTEKECL